MDEKMLKAIDKFTEENYDAIFRDIARLVAVPSVEGEHTPDAPFGPGPKAALHQALEIADDLGLGVRNCEEKIGYAYIGGEGDKYISTITHADVVPTGNGWKADPFIMRERDGYILGRGVADDKGPTVICLYALKFLKEQGIDLRYPVRALIGANEESGMGDVEHYLKNYPAPLFCFSPDADFPLICGEKGIWHGVMKSASGCENILDIHGGFAVNAIPDLCEATVRAENLASTADVEAVKEGEAWHLTAHGIAGHASLPEGTRNAIGIMIRYLLDNNVVTGDERKFLELASLVHEDFNGKALGIAAESEGFTPLTMITGIIGIEDGKIYQTLDCRYVPTTSGEKIYDSLCSLAGDTAVIVAERDAKPFYKSPDCAEIVACMNAYRLITGESDAKPFTIGGGTYARDFPNAVGFGPEHPDNARPDFAGFMHGAEEAASKAELIESLKVYIVSLLNLEEVDF